MERDLDGPVVVAVGDDVGPALDWAAAEAAARGCRLHVVHAERLRWAVDPSGLVPVADFWSYRATAVPLLREAVQRARSVASDVDVVAELAFGPTVPSILCRSRGAQLLVLDSRTSPFRSGLARRLTSSTGGRVAGRAHCPVAVVRPLRSHPQAGSPPRVVVGVDVRRPCAATLDIAFRAAAQRGVQLAAVHAWTPDVPADHEAVCGPVTTAEGRAEELLREVLAPWQSRFPGVPVATRLCIGDPAAVVVRESDGAALAVVGSGARGAVRTLFGSVSRSVARRAGCPVVVVRTGAATVDEHAESGRRTALPGRDPRGTEPRE
jgi:nucleotide-binding universal stress UspA family protein